MIPSIALVVFVLWMPGPQGAAPAQAQPPAAPHPSISGQPTNQPLMDQPLDPRDAPYTTPVVITGSVALSDGTPVPAYVPVGIICGMNVLRMDTNTDSHGNFRIVWNDHGTGVLHGATGQAATGRSNTNSGPNRLLGCEVRATPLARRQVRRQVHPLL